LCFGVCQKQYNRNNNNNNTSNNTNIIIIIFHNLQSGHCSFGGKTEQRDVGADQRKAERVHDGRIAVLGRLGDTGRNG